MKPLSTILPPSAVLASRLTGDLPVSSLVNSTQALTPGALYFAIKGSRTDGHDLLSLALAQGAAAVVVETRVAYEACPRALWVESTRRALGEAADRWYEQPTCSIDLVGVTGTNGKTTTTFLLDRIRRAAGLKTGIIGTVEYRIGETIEPAPLTTPDALTLQSLFARMRNAGVTHAAMEVSSIALDQHRTAGCRFHTALFTNLTPDHLDYHGTMENYLRAKARLFEQSRPKFAVLNADDPAHVQLKAVCSNPTQVLTYSTGDGAADFRVEAKELTAAGIRARIATPAGELELVSPLLGLHNLSNCLGVLAVHYCGGGDLSGAVQALRDDLGAPGRLERVAEAPGRPYVFVDYAHTEDALRNVLESLRRVRGSGKGRIVTVFGCGGDRDRSKRPRMGAVAAELSDILVLTSDNPRTENPEGILDEVAAGIPNPTAQFREVDRRRAICLALETAQPGDFVLVAGKGHETYQIVGEQKVPFDDRRVIRDYYGV